MHNEREEEYIGNTYPCVHGQHLVIAKQGGDVVAIGILVYCICSIYEVSVFVWVDGDAIGERHKHLALAYAQ